LNQARIFEIPTDLYLAFYHLADRLTTKLSGWDWKPAKRDAAGEFVPDEEMQKDIAKHASLYESVVQKHCRYMWPDKFPFDTCYLALTPPLELNDVQRGMFSVESCDEAWLYAFLVTSDGYVCTFIDVVKGDNAGVASVVECSKVDELRTWGFPLTLSPWVITWMVEWINEHQVTIEDKTCSFSYRNSYKKASKKLKMHSIPPPYYIITMREDLLHAKEQKVMTTPRKHWELQYRHDVRGCTNCRIMRGPLPLDPQLEKLLRRDKRRKIFTDTLPDEETARELAKRRVSPKHKDEWMAVLLYWRKDHLKGPKDAPFIPAIRRSSRKRLPKIEDENARQP
jgi:hypothetical protein